MKKTEQKALKSIHTMISTLSFSIHLFTRHFNHNRVTLPASGADRSNANSTATALQLISKCQYNPRAACADRMSKRYCTTIDVYFFRIKSCDFITRKRYRRESFVHFKQINVSDRFTFFL